MEPLPPAVIIIIIIIGRRPDTHVGNAADATGPAGIRPCGSGCTLLGSGHSVGDRADTGPRLTAPEVRPIPEPSHHPHPIAALAALIATLDAVSLATNRTADDDNGDRQRAGLLHLILIDYRTFCSATRR